jgi:LysM repeat protein
VARPSLRLIEGGRSPQVLAQQQRYQRRRAVAVVVALVVGLLGIRGAAAVVSGLAAGTAGPGSTPVATTTHRASAGDTLWEIAGRYAPGVDRRIAMDDLLAINGGATLQVGQEVLLPASWF